MNKLTSRKFIGLMLIVIIWAGVILLTYLRLPENQQAWAFLTFLTPWAIGLVAAYMGVNYLTKKVAPND